MLASSVPALQRAAGNRAVTGLLAGAPSARGFSVLVQRLKDDAREYIRKNGLSIRAALPDVRAYVQDPRNPLAHRQALAEAWNRGGQSAQVGLDPPSVLPAREPGTGVGLGERADVPPDISSVGGTEKSHERETQISSARSAKAADVHGEGETEGGSAAPKSEAEEPQAFKSPTLLQSMTKMQGESSGQSNGSPPQPALRSEAYKAPEVITAHQALAEVQGGDDVDRVLHEVAVKLAQVSEQEVPLFTQGLPAQTGQAVESPPKPKSKWTPKSKVTSAPSSNPSTGPDIDEKNFFKEHRKTMKSSTLGPELTSALVVLRQITRLYQQALHRVSPHPMGCNVFTYLGTDYVVNEGKYVRPYDASFGQYLRKEDRYLAVPGTVYAAFDYPATVLSLNDLRRIVRAIIEDRVPPVSSKQMTVFIAAVAAESTRYAPQMASVMLALSGVTDATTTQHESVFVEGLTMTTGSTDPGSGKHVDARSGFLDQKPDTPHRATDVAAKREGALILSAFSQTGLGVNVRAYIADRLAEKVGHPAIVDDLVPPLISLMNRRARIAFGAGGLPSVQLDKFVSKEMRDRHFPVNREFSSRNVEKDSIVILEPREAEQLAWDMANSREGSTWKESKFRTFGAYRVAKKVGTKVQFGRAHISLSMKGSPTQLNHWEGEDFLGDPQECTVKTLGDLIKASSLEKQLPSVGESQEDPEERVARLMGAVDKLDEKNRLEISAQLSGVLDGVKSRDPVGRRRALTTLSQMEELVLQGGLSPGTLARVVQEYLPSNEWNIMPQGLQRGEASGAGHNCLIDTLLQLTTGLPQNQRLLEAVLIRAKLVEEGVTQPMAYLYAYQHARRVLELIGVDPENYEIRTEWTHGGLRQIAEVEGQDNPTVLRLWNTGGHYEPITVPPNVDTADLADHQTNTKLERAARPAWMTARLLEAGQGQGVASLDEKTLLSFESKRPAPQKGGTAVKEKEKKGEGDQPGVLEVPGFPRWQVSESSEKGVKWLTFTDQEASPPLKSSELAGVLKGFVQALQVSQQAHKAGLISFQVISGPNRFVVERGSRRKET
jgi:hypothetical protein